MSSFNRLIKRVVHGCGFDLHRLNPYANPAYQLLAGLKRFEVDVVFDVGANIGQFASELRSVGYQGKIVSFEPLSSAHAALTKAAAGDSQWVVPARVAIGDHDGEITINIAGNSVSSSVLPMLDLHSTAEKSAAYVSSERVALARLDSIVPHYLAGARRPFVKIDTQGFEWQVLDGMLATLPATTGVLVEMSLVPLYAGQRLWQDLIDRLSQAGFTLWSVQQGFTDPRDGRTLQLDGIFFRA
jgi:FkbM family methyltransferase